MSRPDVVASCETAKRIVDALLMATSEDVHEKLTRLDKGQPGSVLRSLRLTRDRLTGERGSEIMLKGPTAERLKVRVNELVGNVGLVGASVFDLSEEDREHANRAPVALSIPLRDELVRASSALDRLLGSAVELRNWREIKEAELASLVETSDAAVNAIRHQRRVEIAGEIALVNQRETDLLGDVYEVSNAVRRRLEERTHLLSNLIRLGLGSIPTPQVIPSPNDPSSPPELDQGLIEILIDILTDPTPYPDLPDEVKRFIESVFESIDWRKLLVGMLPVYPGGLPKFLSDYYAELFSNSEPLDLLGFVLNNALHFEELVRTLLLLTGKEWFSSSPFLQPMMRQPVRNLGTFGSFVIAGKEAWDSGENEWHRQQERKARGEIQYSNTQIGFHSVVDATAAGVVTFVLVEGVGIGLKGVPYAGPLLAVGWKVFVGPPVADFVNKNITAPIMDNKYVEAGIDVVYEKGRDVLGKTVHGAGEVVSSVGDGVKRVGEKLDDAGKKLEAWGAGLFR